MKFDKPVKFLTVIKYKCFYSAKCDYTRPFQNNIGQDRPCEKYSLILSALVRFEFEFRQHV